MLEWMMFSLRLLLILCKDVLGEGMLNRSMTLPWVRSFIISPRMDQGLSEEGVENTSDPLFVL